jgi:hypothetical protein
MGDKIYCVWETKCTAYGRQNVLHKGDKISSYRVLVEYSESKRPLGTPRRRWTITLKLISKMWDAMAWTGLISFMIETEDGCM